MKYFLGLGKTKYNSSISVASNEGDIFESEIYLTERINKKKNSGSWPQQALQLINDNYIGVDFLMSENRDVHTPRLIEDIEDQLFPFYDALKLRGLEKFTSKHNPDIKFVPHHLAHAYASLAISPFEKSIIVVCDGAGNEEENLGLSSHAIHHEECSVFLQDGAKLTLAEKRYVNFNKSKNWNNHTFGNRVGALYEKASEYIFNNPNSSGKVMGLAPFFHGEFCKIEDVIEYQENLKWQFSFKGSSKIEWEKNQSKNLYIQIASEVQEYLERDFENLLTGLREKYPHYRNLILTGGCALNCTNNAKVYYRKTFDKIFIPPFPGDESIGFGLSQKLKIENDEKSWKPLKYEEQSGYFGPKTSVPNDYQIEKIFSDSCFQIYKNEDIVEVGASELAKGKIIAWFQGRSESGPRALGNRSILARADKKELKNFLNQNIKFRESFRPYGCSVPFEYASTYFDVDDSFYNPYMSFAVKVKNEYQEILKEVSHVDLTSRMQSVRPGQNKLFYDLLHRFGLKTGLYCLLNTSLNIMDQPILEDINDAKEFLQKVPVDALIIGNYFITFKK